eukprot:m.193137 g.193137  ORF g.193137 m.193137 type:complete len:1369 (+) comp16974_c0_seq2:46-4152(+)
MADLLSNERLRRRMAIEGHVVTTDLVNNANTPSLCGTDSTSLQKDCLTVEAPKPEGDVDATTEIVFDDAFDPSTNHAGVASSYYGNQRPSLYAWLREPESSREQAVEARRNELLADEALLASAQGQQEWLALLNYRNQAVEAVTLLSPQKQREQQDSILADEACVECAARGKLVRFTTFRPRVWCANCGRFVCGGCAPSKILLPNTAKRRLRCCNSCCARLTEARAGLCVRTIDAAGDEAVHWLVELPASLWRCLSNITELHMENTNLRALPPAVEQLKTLRVLNLTSNRLTELPTTLGRCVTLEQLLLGCNALSELPDTLGKLTKLTRLDVSGNRLLGVGSWIKLLVHLEELDLSDNRAFASETLAYIAPPTLTRLRLAHIALGAVPPHVWKLTALTELSVAHAGMQQLAPKVGLLAHLTRLDVSYNQLGTLPPQLDCLENLQELCVAGNPLKVLPPFIFRLWQLRKLVAASCQLTSLPPRIAALAALQELDVSQNQILSLPAVVSQLPKLRVLNARDNPCSEGMAQGQGTSVARSAKFDAESEPSLAQVTIIAWPGNDVPLAWLMDLFGDEVQYLARRLHSMDDRCDPLDDDDEEKLLPSFKAGKGSKSNSSAKGTTPVDNSVESPQVFHPMSASTRLSASNDLFQTTFLQDYQAEFELCSVNTGVNVSPFDVLGSDGYKDDTTLTCQVLGPTTVVSEAEQYAQMCSLSLLASALPAPRLHLLCYQLQADLVVDPDNVQRLVHNVLTSFPTDHLQVVAVLPPHAKPARFGHQLTAIQDAVQAALVARRRVLTKAAAQVPEPGIERRDWVTPSESLKLQGARVEHWSRITDSVANTCCHVSLVAINELTTVVKAFKTRLERVATPFSQQLGAAGSRATAALANLVKHVRSEFQSGRVLVWLIEVEHLLRQAQEKGQDKPGLTMQQMLVEVVAMYGLGLVVDAGDTCVVAHPTVAASLSSFLTPSFLAWVAAQEMRLVKKSWNWTRVTSSEKRFKQQLAQLRFEGKLVDGMIGVLASAYVWQSQEQLTTRHERISLRSREAWQAKHSQLEALSQCEPSVLLDVLKAIGLTCGAALQDEFALVPALLPEACPDPAKQAWQAVYLPANKTSAFRIFHLEAVPPHLLGALLSLCASRYHKIAAWQRGALLTTQYKAVVSIRCLPALDGGVDLCLIAVTHNTALPEAYNELTAALLPAVACLEHVLASQFYSLMWEASTGCAACLQHSFDHLDRDVDIPASDKAALVLLTEIPSTAMMPCAVCGTTLSTAAMLLNFFAGEAGHDGEQALRDQVQQDIEGLGLVHCQSFEDVVSAGFDDHQLSSSRRLNMSFELGEEEGDWNIVEFNRRVTVNIPLPTHALASENALATQFWR